jgi:threonine synthase
MALLASHPHPRVPLRVWGCQEPKVGDTVRYVSTRGQAPELGFEDTLLAGLARDGGLYVPKAWPAVAPAAIAKLAGQPFADITASVMAKFTGRDFTRGQMLALAHDAYAGFGHPAVTPLVQIARATWVLELFHGPTLAFKDVAMQLLARLIDQVLMRRDESVVIVGATSGDTGGAAIEAFRGSKRVDVVILYPHGRVSDIQRRMMTTAEETNVHAVSIDGTFDDCQALVKAMFNNLAFRDRMKLAAVNSINWARVAAQIGYYFAAATALGGPHRPVSFAVPTGNFGDILAGYAAKRMGLPIGDLVIASNENDILARAYAHGEYETRAVVATTSPSMDIQLSSNFERYLFEAGDRDAAWVRAKMGALRQNGSFELARALPSLRRDFLAASASQAEVSRCIRRVKQESGYLLDPHSACAAVAAEKTRIDPTSPLILLATAHPAKFPDAIEAITGERPPLPARLGSLLGARERFTTLPNDAAALERFVEGRAASKRGAAA